MIFFLDFVDFDLELKTKYLCCCRYANEMVSALTLTIYTDTFACNMQKELYSQHTAAYQR